jgi:hypothetical protein
MSESRSRYRDRDHVRWRARCLIAAGFPVRMAHDLAADERIDVHALLELTDRGCPAALAARILAPLEHPLERQPEASAT